MGVAAAFAGSLMWRAPKLLVLRMRHIAIISILDKIISSMDKMANDSDLDNLLDCKRDHPGQPPHGLEDARDHLE
jgi:hypothetical protein